MADLDAPVTEAEWEALYEQNNRACPICKTPLDGLPRYRDRNRSCACPNGCANCTRGIVDYGCYWKLRDLAKDIQPQPAQYIQMMADTFERDRFVLRNPSTPPRPQDIIARMQQTGEDMESASRALMRGV